MFIHFLASPEHSLGILFNVLRGVGERSYLSKNQDWNKKHNQMEHV